MLRVCRRTIDKYLSSSSVPRYPPRPRHSQLDPYKPYLQQRWQAEGCHNNQLLEEIQERGYQGSAALLGSFMGEVRANYPVTSGKEETRGRKRAAPKPQSQPLLSAREAAFLMLKKPEALDEREQSLVAHLRKFDLAVEQVYLLSQEFVGMIRERGAKQLEGWLAQIEQSGIAELQSFSKGIKRDKAAVLAGLSLEWSQGQVEGQVNRIKMIKRMMFGRAGFDLLRKRVMYMD